MKLNMMYMYYCNELLASVSNQATKTPEKKAILTSSTLWDSSDEQRFRNSNFVINV